MARRVSRWRTRVCASILCALLVAQPLLAQSAQPASSEPGQAAPTRLQIQVLTPVPMLEPAGALSANRVMVQVLDGWGMPVPGAAVSFRLPEAGPGGAFLNGLSTEVAIADREGKAAVQGFDWRAEAGTSFLHVIAAYGDIRAGAMVEVQLGRKVTGSPPAVSASGASRPAETAAVPPSAFPLPEESHVGRQTAAPAGNIGRQTAAPAGEPPPERSSGRAAIGQNRTKSQVPSPPARAAAPNPVVPNPAAPAPRETVPSAPLADYQSPSVADTASYVTVKRKSGGGGKTLLFLVVAAAAAGGAVAAVVGSGGSASSGGNGSGGTSPGSITIGSPSISVTGGAN